MTGPAMLSGETSTYIDINDVRSHSIKKTLADEEVRYGGAILVDITIERLAHEMDRKPTDFEVMAHDIVPQLSDPLMWGVDVVWWIPCDECEYTAVQQDTYDADLCPLHLAEAYKETQADLDNDDRWLLERGLL